jgi:hypothetical protein
LLGDVFTEFLSSKKIQGFTIIQNQSEIIIQVRILDDNYASDRDEWNCYETQKSIAVLTNICESLALYYTGFLPPRISPLRKCLCCKVTEHRGIMISPASWSVGI